VTWQLATAVPALVHPNEHFCVAPNVLTYQARWLAPTLKLSKTPGGQLYVRLLAMASMLIDELNGMGIEPRDLLDVHDFVALTLRPAARKRLPAMPKTTPDAKARAEAAAEAAAKEKAEKEAAKKAKKEADETS
jgi:hypothetical protein